MGMFDDFLGCKSGKNTATGFGVRLRFVPEAVTFIFRGDAEAQKYCFAKFDVSEPFLNMFLGKRFREKTSFVTYILGA